MSQRDLVKDEIAQVIDILERITDLNRMIDLHKEDKDDLMIGQYEHLRTKLIKEFKGLLSEFNISPSDLAA